jgi:hypothetical protein
MPEVLDDLLHLPLGSHCVSFHVSRDEAADHALAFLAGAPEGQAAQYWVPDAEQRDYYTDRAADEAPDHVGCISVLPCEQVEPREGHLRPVKPVLDFIQAHPEGVTASGETISRYWAPHNVPDHLEYEAWFEEQPRDLSRFLCPYDLRSVPAEDAPRVMRELGAHHTHVVFSESGEPGVKLLQLFVFPDRSSVPEVLRSTLGWADGEGLLAPTEDLRLTPRGQRVVQDWGRNTVLDW